MKKLITPTLLTVAAVPFLMAAPTAAHKAQNTTPAAAKTKTHKTHGKKGSKTGAKTAPATTPSK